MAYITLYLRHLISYGDFVFCFVVSCPLDHEMILLLILDGFLGGGTRLRWCRILVINSNLVLIFVRSIL